MNIIERITGIFGRKPGAASDFEAQITKMGATILPMTAFTNTGGQFGILEDNVSFLQDVAIKTEVPMMEGDLEHDIVRMVTNTQFQRVIVRRKGNEYYLKTQDDMFAKTVVS